MCSESDLTGSGEMSRSWINQWREAEPERLQRLYQNSTKSSPTDESKCRCVSKSGCACVSVTEKRLRDKNCHLDPVHTFTAMTRFTSPYALSLCISTIYYNRFLFSMYCTLLPTLQNNSAFDLQPPAQTAFSWPHTVLIIMHTAEHRFDQHFQI